MLIPPPPREFHNTGTHMCWFLTWLFSLLHGTPLPRMQLINVFFAPLISGPEFMPLDCSLFSDLVRSLQVHTRLTASLAVTDDRKFSMATPKTVSKAIRRLWDPINGGVPSSERIMQDIRRCSQDHVKAVIEAEGAIVHGIGSRNGHRKRPTGAKRGGPRKKNMDSPNKPAWLHEHAVSARKNKSQESIIIALAKANRHIDEAERQREIDRERERERETSLCNSFTSLLTLLAITEE